MHFDVRFFVTGCNYKRGDDGHHHRHRLRLPEPALRILDPASGRNLEAGSLLLHRLDFDLDDDRHAGRLLSIFGLGSGREQSWHQRHLSEQL